MHAATFESNEATVIPLPHLRGQVVTKEARQARCPWSCDHTPLAPTPAADRCPVVSRSCGEPIGMMRDGHLDGRLWQDTHELNGGDSDAKCTSIVARATST